MKRVYKITPVSLYDIRGLESWLEDMARRGLFLKRLRAIHSTFERGLAQSLRYRAEPFRQTMMSEVPQAMLDLHQDFGWDLVCETEDLLIFSTENENAPEPHSDPELQGTLWKKLYRSKRRGFFFELALNLAILASTFGLIFGAGTPILSLLTAGAPILILHLVFFSLIILPGLWANVQRLGLIVKQLDEGIQLNHRSTYPQRRWIEIVNFVIITTLLVSIITVQNILPRTGGGMQPLDKLTAFPLLSLAEVEGEGFTSHSVVMNGTDYANFCELNHHLLCPNQWSAVQTGGTAMDNWIRMEVRWYDLPDWLSGLSTPLARELFHSTMGLVDNIWWTNTTSAVWTADYLPYEGTDFLAVAHSDNGFQLASAAVGDKVVLVKYTGGGDLSAHLDKIVDMVR